MGLTNIILPDSITEIGGDAFHGCENIKVTYRGNVYDYANIIQLYTYIY